MSSHQVQWAPKLPVALIARLYEWDAAGTHDDELLNDVGWRLLARCRSLTLVTKARVVCPQCATEFDTPWVGQAEDLRHTCPSCGWGLTAGEYHASFRHQDLVGPGLPMLEEFLQRFPKAGSYAARMLLVDRLVHAVHATGGGVARSLLEGRPRQVLRVLDTIASSRRRVLSEVAEAGLAAATGREVSRDRLIADLAALLVSRQASHTLRVAVDGPDASGKSTLADELAHSLSVLGRPVVRASVDGFHRPKAARHRRGILSAEGYYLDSFDYGALRRVLLDPLGPAGDGRYRPAAFDLRADAPLTAPEQQVPPDAVLLLDGVFLLREELRESWEFTVIVEVSPDEAVRRAVVRDADLLGSEAAVRERYRCRYLPGQELYRARVRPAELADVIVDNDRPLTPVLVKWPDLTEGRSRDTITG